VGPDDDFPWRTHFDAPWQQEQAPADEIAACSRGARGVASEQASRIRAMNARNKSRVFEMLLVIEVVAVSQPRIYSPRLKQCVF
jgi:hypothetical protein